MVFNSYRFNISLRKPQLNDFSLPGVDFTQEIVTFDLTDEFVYGIRDDFRYGGRILFQNTKSY